MTTELEQEFYDTFGIEPKWKDKRVKNAKTYYTEEQAEYLRRTTKNRNIQLCYPEITAEKSLEMICILNSIYDCGFKNNTSLASKEIKYLKMEILKHCILHKKQIKTQIQQLFKD